jgi:ABC-type Fe3+-hydroxamate transport system substrate-binding protein
MLIHLLARFGVPMLVVALVQSATAPSNAQTTYQPLTVAADSGVQAAFTAPPQRMVSLNPGHTATVFALGGGSVLCCVLR